MSLKQDVYDWLKDVAALDAKQLKALSQVGACLKESPNTIGFNEDNSIRLCYGFNTPNKTVVQFHIPGMLT